MSDTTMGTGNTDDKQDHWDRTQDEKTREATLRLTEEFDQFMKQHKQTRQFVEVEVKSDDLFMDGHNPTADLMISCQEKNWGAHALILTTRCPFFKACLRSGCEESIRSRIELRDDKPEACGIFLEYLYTQNLIQQRVFYVFTEPDKQERLLDLDILIELCKMAHKYGVPGLFMSIGKLIRSRSDCEVNFKDYVGNLFGGTAYLFLNTMQYDDCTEMLYLQWSMIMIMNLEYAKKRPLSSENNAMLVQHQDLINCLYFGLIPVRLSKLLLSSNEKALEE